MLSRERYTQLKKKCCIQLTLSLGIVVAFSSGSGCTKEQSNQTDPSAIGGNIVDGSDGIIIPDNQLDQKVKQFNEGDLNIALPLQETFRNKRDEVTASIYSRSLSEQERSPNAVALQFSSLTRLKASPSVCAAMKESLETWSAWKDDSTYNYQEGVALFEKMCPK
jgi:hypothetical protein